MLGKKTVKNPSLLPLLVLLGLLHLLMNTPKIGCHDLIQQNHGRIGDLPFQFGDQQNWNMDTAAGSQQQNLWPETERSSSSMVSRFETPASAFYATEKYLGLPHYECQAGPGPSLCPPQQYSSVGSYFVDSGDQTAHNFELRRTNQSILQPHFCGNQPQFHKSFDSSSGNKFHQYDQKPIIANDVGPGVGQFSVPFERNRDHRVACNPYSSPPFAHPVFSAQHENHSPRFSFRVVSASPPANHASVGPVLANKTRIRWTQDLHERFVECVNRLGGPEKATPKAILKLMDSEGLTIFHVKSHLQKYRIAKYLPDTSQGKEEKRTSISALSQIDAKTGMQIREALQIQLDVQRHLHDQLEVQRTLQLRIEEQGRQLKKMFDHQQRTTNSLQNSHESDITSPDEPTFSFEEIDICIAEGSNNSNNSLFPSKIS